jgi:hypothetical protein
MNKAVVPLVIGVLVFLVSLTADSLGIGEGTGIGWKQITGAAIGVVIAAVGMYRLRGSGGK